MKNIRLVDDEGTILSASTNLTEEEILTAVFKEEYDTGGMDYEMKLIAEAELLGKIFTPFEIDEIIKI